MGVVGGARVRVAHDATVQARRGFLATRSSHVDARELQRPSKMLTTQQLSEGEARCRRRSAFIDQGKSVFVWSGGWVQYDAGAG